MGDRSLRAIPYSYPKHEDPQTTSHTAPRLILPPAQEQPYYYCYFLRQRNRFSKRTSVSCSQPLQQTSSLVSRPPCYNGSPKLPLTYYTILQWCDVTSVELRWELRHLEFEGTSKIMYSNSPSSSTSQ